MRTTFLAPFLLLGLAAAPASADEICRGTLGSATVTIDASTIKSKHPQARLYTCKNSVGLKRLDFCTKAATGNDKPEKVEVKIESGDPKKPMTDKLKVDCKKKT